MRILFIICSAMILPACGSLHTESIPTTPIHATPLETAQTQIEPIYTEQIQTAPIQTRPSLLDDITKFQSGACSPSRKSELSVAAPYALKNTTESEMRALVNDYCLYPDTTLEQIEKRVNQISLRKSLPRDYTTFLSIMTWHINQFRRMENNQKEITQKMLLTIKKLTDIETEIDSSSP